MPRFIHPHSLVPGEWLYRPRYIHPHSLVPWEWLCRATMYPPPLSSSRGEGVTMSWHCIFIPHNIWWGGDYIMTLHLHSRQHLVRGWLHRSIIFSVQTIFGEGVIISWHYIFTLDNIWWGGDYIVTLHFHSWQYLVRGWLHCDLIFSLLTTFGEGLIILWPYIFPPDNILWGGDYIVTLNIHSWLYLLWGWLYRDIIFSLLTIFGEGVIISWYYIFTPDIIWWGGDYIVTLHFHSWRSPRMWHWRWLYLNIFTIQIWLQWYQGFIIHIHIVFTSWNLGVEVIIFKHDTLFTVET